MRTTAVGSGFSVRGSGFAVPRSPFRFGFAFLTATTFVVAGPIAIVSAQAGGAISLTLEDAQMRARAESYRLAEMEARESGALAAVQSREAADDPSVSLQAGYLRSNHITEFTLPAAPGSAARVLYPDLPNTFRTRLDLQWPIFTGGRNDALVRAARAEASASAADRESVRADLRLEVARTYWALVTARAAVGVLEQALERAESYVRDAGERFRAGLTAPNEVASAEAAAARQRVLLIEAQNQRELSSAELARLIGAPLDQPIAPTEPLELSAPPSSDAGTPSVRQEHVALEQRLAAAEARRDAAARGRRPSLTVGAGFDYARPNPRIFPLTGQWEDSWDAGVRLAWPLWDGGRVSAEVAEAAAAADATRRRLEELDSMIAVEIRQRRLELNSSRAAVEAADEGVRSAAEARRVVTERYNAGVGLNIEVLDAQSVLLQAELDRTRALAAVRLSQARLTRALGHE